MGTRAALPLPRPGTVLVGRLRIERQIGEGALSVVFEATDLPLNRRVAVKILTPQHAQDAEQRERFIREARASASMANEHIARLIDVHSLDDGTPFLVLEYLEGIPLDEILEREGPPPVHVAVDWILQALDGIAEVHARGLVHRDIKPANLFLAERPNRPSIVKVLDFGTVKDITRRTQLTQTGATLGSPAYMPPEQIRAETDIDARSDVWSFGVTLFELVTGELPFPASSIPVALASILRDEPAPMRRFRSDIPDNLEALVRRCLSKDRNARFANAGELHVALAAVRATMPKTTPATKTIRLAPGQAPPGLNVGPPYNEDVSAVRPRVVITPAMPPRRPSRMRVFVLAASVGFALAALAIGVGFTLSARKPKVPVAPPATTTAPRAELLPPNIELPASAPSIASATPRPVATADPLKVSNLVFDSSYGPLTPPVESIQKLAYGDMFKCVQDAGCRASGGRNITVDEHGNMLAATTIVIFDKSVPHSSEAGVCATPVEPCLKAVVEKHNVHAECGTNEKCHASFTVKFLR